MEILSKHKVELREKYRVKCATLFGSVARNEARPDSDVDVLVDLLPGSSLFDLSGAAILLEEVFGRKVDVVSSGALSATERHKLLSLEPVDESTRIHTRLTSILGSLQGIKNYIGDSSFDEFMADRVLVDATLHLTRVASVFAKRMPDSTRNQNPDIPWTDIIAVGDTVIEQYRDLDMKSVWDILQIRILPSIPAIQSFVGNEPSRSSPTQN